MKGSPVPALTQDETASFWAQTRTDASCRLWTGQLNGPKDTSYGLFTIHRQGRRVRLMAHRVALALATGIFDGIFACHHCDNPPCVNPAHLYWGDARTNAADAQKRGRLTRSYFDDEGQDQRHRRPHFARLIRARTVAEPGAVWLDTSDWKYLSQLDSIAARDEVHAFVERVERGDGVTFGWTNQTEDVA